MKTGPNHKHTEGQLRPLTERERHPDACRRRATAIRILLMGLGESVRTLATSIGEDEVRVSATLGGHRTNKRIRRLVAMKLGLSYEMWDISNYEAANAGHSTSNVLSDIDGPVRVRLLELVAR